MNKNEAFYNLIYYWKSIIWAGIIFILSAISGNELNKVHFINIPNFDKIVHFSLYFILLFLLLAARTKTIHYKQIKSRNAYVFATTTFIYSLTNEVLQKTVFVSRSFETVDLIANLLGIICCLFVFQYYNKKLKWIIKFL
jgi:VanZ like family